MKTVQFPETMDELKSILLHENVTLHITCRGLDYVIGGEDENKFSADKISPRDIMKLISDKLYTLGIIVSWNIEQ